MTDPESAQVTGATDTADLGAAVDRPWHELSGLHPETTKYPARARLEGNGIIIFKTKMGFRGVQRTCPHQQATLLQAALAAGDTMVRCHLHAYTFRLSDGKGVNCPGYRVSVYEIKEEGGVLYGRPAA